MIETPIQPSVPLQHGQPPPSSSSSSSSSSSRLEECLVVPAPAPPAEDGGVKLRDYSAGNALHGRVSKTYELMHRNQTVDFVRKKHREWLGFSHFRATVMEALEKLNKVVDESDPDFDLPNIVHAFQTAERIRRDYPELEWFQVTGLIHDLGKIMAFYGEPQWSVVGDTYPVGCAFQDCVRYRDWSFQGNTDNDHPVYSTKNGMYVENCGLDKVLMSWGHDEYLYQVLVHNKTKIPKEGRYMIRFHSFYPWHTDGGYLNLGNQEDDEMLKWVKLFGKYDIYSKYDELPDVEKLKPYYQGLIDKFCPGVLEF